MRINYKEKPIYIIVLAIFLYMQPFVTWSSYTYSGIFIVLMNICLFGGIIYELNSILNNKIVKKNLLIGFLMIVAFSMYYYCTGNNSLIGHFGIFMQYVFICFFIFDKDKEKIFDAYRKVFAVLLVPSVLFFIINLLGIGFPHELLQDYRENSTRVYLHYPFSVMTASVYSVELPMRRLCGFLDEPGALGTFIALILIITDLNLKDKYNIFLFIAGFMTLSTAYYIIIGLYFILVKFKITTKISRKKMWLLFFAIIATVGILILAQYYGVLYEIFGKLFEGDARYSNITWQKTTEKFGNRMTKYLFGNGYHSGGVDLGYNASWTVLIYDVGIIGILISVICILFAFNDKSKETYKSMIFRILFLLSMMQRPYILTVPYMCLLFIGIEMLSKRTDSKRTDNSIVSNSQTNKKASLVKMEYKNEDFSGYSGTSRLKRHPQ